MQNDIQKRIEQIANDRGETYEGLSVKAGLDRSYVRKIMERNNPQPRRDTMRKMADAWGISIDWLQDGAGSSNAKNEKHSDFHISEAAPASRTIPICGRVAASNASGSEEADKTIGAVPPPPALAKIEGLYALYVLGRSMEPQYFPGDLIFVNPDRPPRIGDCVVIITKGQRGKQRTLGIFESENPEHVVLHKHKSENGNGLKIHIPQTTIQARHKVLTVNEMFGA